MDRPGRVMRASPNDIPAIMAIERRPGFERFVGCWDEERHRAEMEEPGTLYLVLRGEEGVAGFAIVRDLDGLDRRAHLQRIAVVEPGRGDGERLLRALVDHVFAETDTNRLDLDVYAGNDRARRVYERAGFTAEGLLREHHRDSDGTFSDVWLMSILRREWLAAWDAAGGA